MAGGAIGDMGYNSGSSKGSTGQWQKYWQEQEAKKTGLPPPAPTGSLGGLSILGSTQTSGPGGVTSYNTQYGQSPADAAAAHAAEMRLEAQLAQQGASRSLAEREAANNRARSAMFAQYQTASGSGGGDSTPPVNFQANEQAARDAAFARAKEQSGQIAQSSLSALRNSLSRRGITGGGYAQMRGAEALAPATDRLQDFTREGMLQDYQRAGQISDREAAAALTRRGQDMSRQQSLLSLLSAGGRLY